MLADARSEVFARLRTVLAPSAPAAASAVGLWRTGLEPLDALLGGGLPPGGVVTFEGAPGSGASSLLARALAAVTERGVAALIELPHSERGRFDPATLAAAGVDLDRLLLVHARDAAGVARAADILLRGGAFSAVAAPMPAMHAQAWTKLARLAERANAVLLLSGERADSELRFVATVRLGLALDGVEWSEATPFTLLQSVRLRADVMKHRRGGATQQAEILCRRHRE